jgi:hypothetical protein
MLVAEVAVTRESAPPDGEAIVSSLNGAAAFSSVEKPAPVFEPWPRASAVCAMCLTSHVSLASHRPWQSTQRLM